MKFIYYILLIGVLLNLSPCYAFCGDTEADENDKQCNSSCNGTDEDVKGCMPSTPGTCPEGNHAQDVCCCKD